MTALLHDWLPAERAAWRPLERLQPSAWAERHRVLTRMQSARPGPWRNAHAPYLAGLMDFCARRDLEELTIVKGAQIGVSEAVRNVVGYYAHQEPDPILLVLPDEQSGRKIVAQRIIPLLRDTACLRAQFTSASRDIQLRHVTLANGFTLRLGWSGSPATLAADPCRIVINDEVDKFQPWSGRESDPISLGYARTQTYEGRRLIINISTPTTADGLIWQRYESAAVHYRFVVPCPHCREHQPLTFGQVRWKKFDLGDAIREAAAVEHEQAAWYECAHCRGEIDEDQRIAMIRAGRWLAAGQTLSKEGVLSGRPPVGRRVALHLWAGYCLWIPLYRIAAEFLRCKDDSLALMGFANSWLGEPFRQQIAHAKLSVFEGKCTADEAPPARVVPDWAQLLIATADTQKDHFYYIIRAWGAGYRSQRIDHGLATSFDELRERTLDAVFPWEDPGRPPVSVRLLGIDSGGTNSLAGSRTHEVYRFALLDPARIRALKGESRPSDVPIRTRRITYRPPGVQIVPYPVFLTLIDTQHYKDRLASAIAARLPHHRPAPATTESSPPNATVETVPVEQWSLNDANDADYNRQMTSEHKVLVRKAGGRQVEAWTPISAGAANHYWDCEVAQFALADMLRADLLIEAGAQRRSWSERIVRRDRGERPWISVRSDRPWITPR
ncbi:MAG: terminase gpA endonuclease subunit [Phycisphaerae bacterium]